MKESLKTIAAEMEKAAFLNFINEEISAVESKKKDGYTPWMLVAAETVLFSYLLSALEFGQPSWWNVGTLFLFIIFLYDAVESFLSFIIIPSKSMPQQNNRFHIPLYQEFPTRIGALFLFFKICILLFIFHALAFNVVFSFFTIFFLYFMALLSFLVFLLSFSRKSRKKKNKTTDSSTNFLDILVLTPIFVALLGLLLEVLFIYNNLTLTDIKVAFSFATALIVLGFLVKAFSNPPNFGEELKNIKRSLVLDLITTSDAKQQTDKIFFGYTAEAFDTQQIKDTQNNINSLKELILTLENNIENITGGSSCNLDNIPKIVADITSIINSTVKNTPGKFRMFFEGAVERNAYVQHMKELFSLYEKAISLIKEAMAIQEKKVENLRNKTEEENKKANTLEAEKKKLIEEIKLIKQKIANQEKEPL